jgi:UDP:flavonoid glycosyltransferase YjiC (YdhE family)
LAGNGIALPGGLNLALYRLLRLLVWRVMCPAVNGVVRPALGLPRYPWHGPPQDGARGRDKVLYGFSEQVLPRPDDWEDRHQVVGYWFHDDPSWAVPPALQAFLDAGPRPVYIGFGSMVGARSREFTDTLLDGLRQSGQRAVLVTGWGGLSPPEDIDRERVFVLDHAPHDRLLPLMSAAVHHGGAGTSAAVARAGIPSVVIPFFGDQPFWARRLHRLGVAPLPLDRRRFTGDDLAQALGTTQQPTMKRAAAALGQAIRAEDSVARSIDQLRRWQLLPSRTAA